MTSLTSIGDGDGGDNPCSSSPCGLHAICHDFSSGRYICKCDRNGTHTVGNPYTACQECTSAHQCKDGKMCYKGECRVKQNLGCGKSLTRRGRIVGGDTATFGQWPWQISLMRYKEGKFISHGTWEHKCGGVILSDKWVATAAHCVLGENVTALQIRLGELHMRSQGEPARHLDKKILKVKMHSRFDNLTKEFDIVLLQIDVEGITFQPHILPICLPSSNDDLVGRLGWVTGWGKIQKERKLMSDKLRQVEVPIISNNLCERFFRESGQSQYIPRIFLCAGYMDGGRDTCEGDSGGPLVVPGDDNRWFLAGLTSWGIGCGESNSPGVYTRVSEFRRWISKNISEKI